MSGIKCFNHSKFEHDRYFVQIINWCLLRHSRIWSLFVMGITNYSNLLYNTGLYSYLLISTSSFSLLDLIKLNCDFKQVYFIAYIFNNSWKKNYISNTAFKAIHFSLTILPSTSNYHFFYRIGQNGNSRFQLVNTYWHN